MASKIKVDQIEGQSGTTVSLPSGQTLDLSSGSVTLPNTSVTNAQLAGSIDLTSKVTGALPTGNLPTIPVAKGGTGLTSLGSAGQAVVVNSGANALEFSAVGGDSSPAWYGYQSANQTGYNQSTWYDLPTDAEKIDTDGALSTAPSDNYAFTVPSGKAGKYVVWAYFQIYNAGGGNTNNDQMRIKLRKKPSGGSYADYATSRKYIEPDIDDDTCLFHTAIDLAVGDKINIQVYREQGAGTYAIAGDSIAASHWMGFKIA